MRLTIVACSCVYSRFFDGSGAELDAALLVEGLGLEAEACKEPFGVVLPFAERLLEGPASFCRASSSFSRELAMLASFAGLNAMLFLHKRIAASKSESASRCQKPRSFSFEIPGLQLQLHPVLCEPNRAHALLPLDSHCPSARHTQTRLKGNQVSNYCTPRTLCMRGITDCSSTGELVTTGGKIYRRLEKTAFLLRDVVEKSH